jgi:hypothetical protein
MLAGRRRGGEEEEEGHSPLDMPCRLCALFSPEGEDRVGAVESISVRVAEARGVEPLHFSEAKPSSPRRRAIERARGAEKNKLLVGAVGRGSRT